MAEPFALPNETQGELTSEFVHGTDDHLHLVAIGEFDSGGGRIRVRTVDNTHWALYMYTGVSTNDLTGLTQSGLGGVVETDAAYTFPAGAIVERALMGEDVACRIMGPASAVDERILVADGTSGKKAKDGGATIAELALLAGRSGGQTLIGGTAATDDLILRATSGVGASGSDIILQVGNNGATEAMRIQHDGKVGIGTATPAQKLDILSGAMRFSHMTAPGACTGTPVDAPGDDGALTAGVYTYKVTFTNAIGETAIGTVSSNVTIGAPATDWKVSLTGIPLGTDATVTGRKIYRTASGGSTYYLVATIADNTTTELTGVNADNVSDATLITNALGPASSTSSGALYNGTSRNTYMEGTYFGVVTGLYIGLYGANRMLFSPGTYPSIGVRDAAGTNQCQLIFSPATGAVLFDYNGPNTGTFQVRRQLNSDTVFKLDATGNMLFGAAANVGSSGTKTFAIMTGTSPTTHVDDVVQIFSKDASTGGATLGLFTEYDVEDVGTFTATKKGKIWWNGVEYWVQLDAV